MKATTITDTDASAARISSLPNRPTAPKEYGGAGLSSSQLKEYFDSYPELLRERFNLLLDDISADGEDSIIRVIKSGFSEGVTLYEFIQAFRDGRILAWMPLGTGTLLTELNKLRTELNSCLERLSALEGANG